MSSKVCKVRPSQYTKYPTGFAKIRGMSTPENPTFLCDTTTRQDDPLQQTFLQAVAIMARLRAPGGCPWDREQTFHSIQRNTLEETYEVLDAIDRQNWPDLKDELGDLLLQVLFYAEMAQEAGYFTLQQVMENLNAKLIRRHPHVFAGLNGVDKAETVLANWETIKQQEKAADEKDSKSTSLLDEVPRTFPALMEAEKIGKKAASVGFDCTSAEEVLLKLEEEIAELREAMAARDVKHQEEELGDVLFTVVNLARKIKIPAEMALRASNVKFRRRFAGMERRSADGKPLADRSAAELETLWMEAKAEENHGS